MNCKSIWFDWGNVLLPINANKTIDAFKQFRAPSDLRERTDIFHPFEKGVMKSEEFLSILSYTIPFPINTSSIKDVWNLLIEPFPEEHFKILTRLKKNYNLVLVSNTNQIHVNHIRNMMGPYNYNRFIKSFDQVFFSFEMGLRKPDASFFNHVLGKSDFKASQCLLVDDTVENLVAAKKLSIQTEEFNIQEMDLQEKIKEWELKY